VYAAFIEGELKAERERRTVLDGRGIAVVSTSGSLVTLLAAVGAFVSNRKDFQLPFTAVLPLLLTLLGFTVAAALGLLVSKNRWYHVALTTTLYGMVTDHWTDDPVDSRNNVAELNVRTIHTLRVGNDRKATLVGRALWAQLGAVLSLGVAVTLVLVAG
jgi:hypothetical protein